MSANRIDVSDGKYSVVGIDHGRLHALRYGEAWRDLVGDNLVLALAQELDEARTKIRKLETAYSDASWAANMDRQGGA